MDGQNSSVYADSFSSLRCVNPVDYGVIVPIGLQVLAEIDGITLEWLLSFLRPARAVVFNQGDLYTRGT